MVWTMCSLENLQVKVLSRVVVVFIWANAFMYIMYINMAFLQVLHEVTGCIFKVTRNRLRNGHF